MICPKCESQYVKGIDICADCGIELIPVEEFEGNLIKPSDWVIAYTCGDSYEAEMLKTNLESAGIETLILAQKDRNYPTVGDLAIIKVLVTRKYANEAMEIINDINSQNIENENEE